MILLFVQPTPGAERCIDDLEREKEFEKNNEGAFNILHHYLSICAAKCASKPASYAIYISVAIFKYLLYIKDINI